MSEVLLARHAQSFANKRDFAAFGNIDSPLTEKGLTQSDELSKLFVAEYGIDPVNYNEPVLSSEFTRTQQTANRVGFRNIDINPLINEADVDREIGDGKDVIEKHKNERWAPELVRERARKFLDLVQKGELEYQIFFTHGIFIASVLLELDTNSHIFDEKRGYVPLQASITKIAI